MTTVAGFCQRAVAFAMCYSTVTAAARLMRQGQSGSRIVVEQLNSDRRAPAVIVTDCKSD